jgi:hypothetical protein
MFFKPKQISISELTTPIEYYQQVTIIHLIADSPTAIVERLENSLGVIDKPIAIVWYRGTNYRWTHPGIESIVESRDILRAIALARKQMRVKLSLDLARQDRKSKQTIELARRGIECLTPRATRSDRR